MEKEPYSDKTYCFRLANGPGFSPENLAEILESQANKFYGEERDRIRESPGRYHWGEDGWEKEAEEDVVEVMMESDNGKFVIPHNQQVSWFTYEGPYTEQVANTVVFMSQNRGLNFTMEEV